MKGLIQRVSNASVSVDGNQVGQIGRGILLFLGVEKHDSVDRAKRLSLRTTRFRIFPDEAGRMNLSLLDIGGSLLVVPQFTLAADTRSGTRAGFSTAAAPHAASLMYEAFVQEAETILGREKVATGQFGADMQVSLTNNGPVTFMLEVTD